MIASKWKMSNRFSVSSVSKAVINIGITVLLTVGAQSSYGVTIPHEVTRGETLSGIAAKYHVTQAQIIDENGLRATHLQAGQTIRIPDVNAEVIYRVQPGDTLYGLARRYNINLNEIASLNNITSDTRLVIGETLVFPRGTVITSNNTAGTNTPNYRPNVSSSTNSGPQSCVCTSLASSNANVNTPTDGNTHRVSRGETLTQVARDYGVSTTALARANNISTQSLLQIGQVLIIPVASTGSSNAYVPPSVSNNNVTRPDTYRVQSGDGLIKVANRFNVSVESLASLNNMNTYDELRVGQTLRIPQGGTSSNGNPNTYEVQRGDGLIKVANRFNVSVADLARANGKNTYDSLRVGEMLSIP